MKKKQTWEYDKEISNYDALSAVKQLVDRRNNTAVSEERKRINDENVPAFTKMLSGIKMLYAESKEIVTIVEVGQLFMYVQVRFPNHDLLWVMPEELKPLEEQPCTQD